MPGFKCSVYLNLLVGHDAQREQVAVGVDVQR